MSPKPLVCYVTFNNMAITVTSMTKLLKCNSDFDLIICDNDSRDHSWEYIKSLKDPRIIEKKRFEKNFGILNPANYAIWKRKKGQDFCLVENDAALVTLDHPFEKMRKVIEDCGLPGVHACRESFDQKMMSQFKNIKGHYILKKNITGMFYRIRSEVMDKLGFYDEATYAADIDLNARVHKMGMQFAYIKDVMIKIEVLHCRECKLYQRVCKVQGEGEFSRPCIMEGATLNWHFYEHFKRRCMDRFRRTLNSPSVYRGSIYAGNLTPDELNLREQNCQFFANAYEKRMKETGYPRRFQPDPKTP